MIIFSCFLVLFMLSWYEASETTVRIYVREDCILVGSTQIVLDVLHNTITQAWPRTSCSIYAKWNSVDSLKIICGQHFRCFPCGLISDVLKQLDFGFDVVLVLLVLVILTPLFVNGQPLMGIKKSDSFLASFYCINTRPKAQALAPMYVFIVHLHCHLRVKLIMIHALT